MDDDFPFDGEDGRGVGAACWAVPGAMLVLLLAVIAFGSQLGGDGVSPAIEPRAVAAAQ